MTLIRYDRFGGAYYSWPVIMGGSLNRQKLNGVSLKLRPWDSSGHHPGLGLVRKIETP